MGAKISTRYSSYKSQPEVFKLFLNFLLNGPNKTTFGVFLNFEMEILTIFFSLLLTWDPMGVKISKSYSSYQCQPKYFKPVLNFPLNGPHKNTLGIFLKF